VSLFRKPKAVTANVHWSKDYVEHLRSVHFTLIAACIALIVIITSGRAYDPDLVIKQVDQISSYKDSWSETWLRFLQAPDLPFNQSKGSYSEVPGAESLLSCTHVKAGNRFFRLGVTDNPRLVLFGYTPATPSSKSESSSGKAIDASSFPEVIHDFEYLWNNPALVLEFEKIAKTGDYVEGAPRPAYFSNPKFKNSGSFVCATHPDAHAEELKLDGWAQHGDTLLILLRSSSGVILALPVYPSRFAFSPPRNLRRSLSNTPATAPDPAGFENEFSELAIAVGDNNYQMWEGLRKLLADEVGRGDSFEAFGLKFPTSQVTVWGIIVILLLQLYLAVYLIQLSQKEFTFEDPGADVPWIGINMSLPGRAIYFMTLIALPWFTVLLLCARAGVRKLGRSTYGNWKFWNWSWERLSPPAKLQAGGLLVALLFALALAYACWRSRPRLKKGASNKAVCLFE
jgi:hypothetical protein